MLCKKYKNRVVFLKNNKLYFHTCLIMEFMDF